MSNKNAGKEVSAKGQTKKLGHHGLVTNEGWEKWVRVVHGHQGRKNLSKMSWKPGAVSMVLIQIGLIADIMDLRRQLV